MRKVALALVALMLVSALPTVAADPPQPVSWSPYDAVSEVRSIALAANGTTVAAALARPVQAPAGAPGIPSGAPRVTVGDLSILDAETGIAYNGSGSTGAPLGRSHVAVSEDGLAIASLGRDTASSGGGILPVGDAGAPDAGVLKLYYQRTAGRWTPDAPATNLSVVIPGNASALALSRDGNRMTAAVNDNGNYSVISYIFTGSALVTQSSYSGAGIVHGMAASRDLERVAAATQIREGNGTFGSLVTFPFQGGVLPATYYDRSRNGSAYMSVGISADGSRVVAGDNRGQLAYFGTDITVPPLLVTLPGPAVNVSHLALSADGLRAVAATGGSLASVRLGADPIVWNTTFAGTIDDIAMNRTGGIVLVAVNGTDGGAYAYGDVDNTVLWKFGGNVRTVAVNADGTLASFAQRSNIQVVRIVRSISFEFPTGAKSGPAQPIKPLGTATFELKVRNPGSGLERVRFEGPRDVDVTVKLDKDAVTVNPGESKPVTLTVVAGRNYAGTRAFNVTAISLTSNATSAVTLTLTPAIESNVTLLLDSPGEVVVVAGARTEVLLGVVNNGTRDAAVGLRAVQAPSAGGEWNITLDPPTFNLGPSTITTVRATVTPPAGAANGTANKVTFLITGTGIADEVQATFRINPTLGVSIDAPTGRVKLVEPGKTAYYNVTVLNNGSLPRHYVAFYETSSQGGKNWVVDMDTKQFILAPGTDKSLTVRIFAPIDATPNDRVSVLVRARSVPELVNETAVESNVTLFANAIPLQPTTTTPTNANLVPGAGVLAVVAASLSLALLHRGRRS